jgi:hypothetical protein
MSTEEISATSAGNPNAAAGDRKAKAALRKQRERGQSAQVGQIVHDKGVSAAARELGVPRQQIERSMKIESTAPEAKEAARAAGLDDNQSALLEIAAELTAAQIARHMARRKELWEMKETGKEKAVSADDDLFAAPPHDQETGGKTLPTHPQHDSLGRRKSAQQKQQFSAEAAERTGQSKRAVNMAVSRGEKIAPDVLDAVTGTALDTGGRRAESGPENTATTHATRRTTLMLYFRRS